jgi:predicted XRE-type DNA-binding protein
MSFNKEKFKSLLSSEKSDILEKWKWQEENEYWLRVSSLIALRVLRRLREKKLSNEKIADHLGVSVSKFKKMMRGQYNFTLMEIGKLEKILDEKLLILGEYERD